MSTSGNEAGHSSAMAGGVFLSVAVVTGDIFALEDLSHEIRMAAVYPGIDDGDCDTLAL